MRPRRARRWTRRRARAFPTRRSARRGARARRRPASRRIACELLALLAREAGKTLPDALGEVREAADFCRYYAMLARRHFAHPRGAARARPANRTACSSPGAARSSCISPWNFPLAIFVGQVAAALAAGNAVVAKPAEQTPLVAHRAVRLLHEAGMPARGARTSCPGRGETVGAALVADPRTAGVAFTGSTATARAINRALAARDGPIVPFIAETGGLNAMLVDSSALPEQVVADVLASAFNSAGQRCSALRVLCLQEEIAPRVIEMLAGRHGGAGAGRSRAPRHRRGPGDRRRGARDAGGARGEDGPRGEAPRARRRCRRTRARASSSRRAPTRSRASMRSTARSSARSCTWCASTAADLERRASTR